jgi:hypothetical protein
MSCPDSDPAAYVQALRAKSTDNSPSGRLRVIKAQTLATYYANNRPLNDFGGSAKPQSGETLLLREVGTNQLNGTCNYCNPCVPVCDISGVNSEPLTNDPTDDGITGPPFYWEATQQQFFSAGYSPALTIPAPPSDFPTDHNINYGWIFGVPPVCNATSYTVSWSDIDGTIPANITNMGTASNGTDTYVFFAVWPLRTWDFSSNNLTVTAVNECSSNTADVEFGCFLEGAPVSMADGTTKPIETVQVGDKILGAFGETNTVTALHRPKLGAGSVVTINGEHSTTTHHPHIGVDHKFYCVKPDILSDLTYGRNHTITIANGIKIKKTMPGVSKDRLATLQVGTELQTITGSRTVNSIVYKPISPFTEVYHLVVDGSHTYNVEGYAVTGWATDTDFDYDTWTPK